MIAIIVFIIRAEKTCFPPKAQFLAELWVRHVRGCGWSPLLFFMFLWDFWTTVHLEIPQREYSAVPDSEFFGLFWRRGILIYSASENRSSLGEGGEMGRNNLHTRRCRGEQGCREEDMVKMEKPYRLLVCIQSWSIPAFPQCFPELLFANISQCLRRNLQGKWR